MGMLHGFQEKNHHLFRVNPSKNVIEFFINEDEVNFKM